MERIKKISLKTMALFSLVAVMLIGCCTTAFAAGNYSDTWFEFYTDNSGGDYLTPIRGKWDYTSSYVYNNNSDCGIRVNVMGCSANGRTMDYCSVNGLEQVELGQWKYLPNWVKERGYNYCRLMVTAAYHYPVHLQCLWSPDSI